ncbi:MAG TPA: phasin family protein [Stellaceae bacterium]|nr:phasin family protein [Stellaceae bacterium]
MSAEKPVRLRRAMVATAPSDTVSEPLPDPHATTDLVGPQQEAPAVAEPPQERADKLLNACRATLASIGASQAAIASDITAMALEVSGLARSNLTAAGDSMTALFQAKSLVDAVEIQFGLARRSLDAMVGGSTKIGEIGLHLMSEAAKPILGRLPPG